MTTEGLKERLRELNGEEEKKTLQDLVQNLKRMLNEQNEYITMLRGEHNGQTLKQRWTLEAMTHDMARQQVRRMEVLAHDISQEDL